MTHAVNSRGVSASLPPSAASALGPGYGRFQQVHQTHEGVAEQQSQCTAEVDQQVHHRVGQPLLHQQLLRVETNLKIRLLSCEEKVKVNIYDD